ncbi:MAG: cbb3-type cytochrome c oxidase subunit 3 [Alphaproteobacteria bacterium]|nr:cbb3-type cytochrome c oxidase subunit 3 [Alphaproteobacteria bacterium]
MNLFDLAMTVRPLFLVWMFAIFLYIAWRAWSPARRQLHHEHGMIPLRDDTPSPANTTQPAVG